MLGITERFETKTGRSSRIYNGRAYKKNRYDEKLKEAYDRSKSTPAGVPARLEKRAAGVPMNKG